MPSEPVSPDPVPPAPGESGFSGRLDSEIGDLRARLARLDAQPRIGVEADGGATIEPADVKAEPTGVPE